MDFVVDKLGCRSAKDANEKKVHVLMKIPHHNQDIENTLNINFQKIYKTFSEKLDRILLGVSLDKKWINKNRSDQISVPVQFGMDHTVW